MELEGLAPTVFTGMILADFGAEVTIITRESGMSDVGPPMHLNYMNRGKKSLILNLKDSNHVNIFKRMVKSADILIDAYRPMVLEKIGLGY